jgi:hypothetical protein
MSDQVSPLREPSTRNPLSLNELSTQKRSIRLVETAVALRLLGAIGIVCGVVAPAVFEYAENTLRL